MSSKRRLKRIEDRAKIKEEKKSHRFQKLIHGVWQRVTTPLVNNQKQELRNIGYTGRRKRAFGHNNNPIKRHINNY